MTARPTAPHALKPTPQNRLGLDYRAEAERLGPPVAPMIDVHTHVNGVEAARLYAEARECFGIARTYSMSRLDGAEQLKDVLGDSIRFIAVPNYMSDNPEHAHTQGFIEDIDRWHELGSRVCKFWCAPRGRDLSREFGVPDLTTLDHPWRRKQMDHAASKDMMFMAHIADPDTWFATHYKDASIYGTKEDQYEPLERALDEYPHPWILAHMGGSPENLDFLSGLLERHHNAYLDTSATKWMVRELSAQPTGLVRSFFDRWKGRILFGSDIVTFDEHLTPEEGPRGRGKQAASRDEAFDLYASRYWALRTLFETSYDGESPIADPDLALTRPGVFDEMSAPRLRGHALPGALLKSVYHDAPVALLDRWHDEHN